MSEVLVDQFLEYKGFHKQRGGSTAPLMPNIIADYIYLVWDEFIKGKVKNEVKQQSNRMYNFYRKFNREFFGGFDKKQGDSLIDIMDEFSEFIKNEVFLFKMAVRNRYKANCKDRETLELFCNIALCRFLTSQANEIWGVVYRGRYGERTKDPNLAQMEVAAREMLYEFVKKYLPKCVNEDVSDAKDVELSKTNFEKRVLNFIKAWSDAKEQ